MISQRGGAPTGDARAPGRGLGRSLDGSRARRPLAHRRHARTPSRCGARASAPWPQPAGHKATEADVAPSGLTACCAPAAWRHRGYCPPPAAAGGPRRRPEEPPPTRCQLVGAKGTPTPGAIALLGGLLVPQLRLRNPMATASPLTWHPMRPLFRVGKLRMRCRHRSAVRRHAGQGGHRSRQQPMSPRGPQNASATLLRPRNANGATAAGDCSSLCPQRSLSKSAALLVAATSASAHECEPRTAPSAPGPPGTGWRFGCGTHGRSHGCPMHAAVTSERARTRPSKRRPQAAKSLEPGTRLANNCCVGRCSVLFPRRGPFVERGESRSRRCVPQPLRCSEGETC